MTEQPHAILIHTMIVKLLFIAHFIDLQNYFLHLNSPSLLYLFE